MGALTRLLAPGGVAGKVAETLKNRKSKGKDSGGGGGTESMGSEAAEPPAYKRGGKVRKSGIAMVHKGERVLTAKQEKRRKRGRGGKRR